MGRTRHKRSQLRLRRTLPGRGLAPCPAFWRCAVTSRRSCHGGTERLGVGAGVLQGPGPPDPNIGVLLPAGRRGPGGKISGQEEDVFVRCVSVLSNLADQLYYPCEHIAWAADAKVLHVDSAWWWSLSTALWGLSLLLGIARSLWMVLKLRKKLRSPTAAFTSQLPRSKWRAVEAQIQSEVLTVLSNLADLANAVHWLPPGVLWAGRFPVWLVGLLGTVSSLLSVYQAVRAGGRADATTP
ncbi:PREDICTED: peroxisomal membrane protein 11C isoform X2 [Hipposideros armiger]|uniref:Peroxisomal membrane protein 11C isoform X2 n=1 Tax=Hipposideros armiger TaxID=186990 RepID=A0A8B7TBY4_HIPAR|nr:PREDICTED: peroxisomal membrane protein 11C isoform X2 [Hipposideros armiger]